MTSRPTAAPTGRVRARRCRRSRLSRFLLVLVLFPLLTGALGSPPAASGDELSDAVAQQKALAAKIAQQKQQVAQLTAAQSGLDAQIASTRASLATISTNLVALQAQVTDLTAQVNKVKAQYAGLLAQLAQLDARLRQIEAQERQKATELAQRKALLASRIRAAYRTDQTSLLETILSAQSFADVLSDVGYYIDIGEADKALAQQIVKDQEALAALHQTVAETRQATDQMRIATAAQKKKLDAQVTSLQAAQARMRDLQAQTARQLAAQKTAMAKLVANKAALQAAIRANGAAQDALRKQIDKLTAAQFARGNIPSQFNGRLIWPMGGQVSQDFGCTGVVVEPPLGSCPHFHKGIDLVAPYGTPVHAAGKGVVVFVGYNPFDSPPAAWIVIIAHSDGVQTWYAHMEPITPAGIGPGNPVAAGQVIGYEGSTGHSTGAHLHWAVELNGTFVNPRLFV